MVLHLHRATSPLFTHVAPSQAVGMCVLDLGVACTSRDFT